MSDTVAAVVEFPGIQTLGSKLLVHIPQRMEDTLVVGGRKLYFDGDFAEHFNKKNAGVIVGCPARLTSDDYLLTRRGATDTTVPVSDIQDELRLGDIVYLQWTVSERGNEVGQQYLPEGAAPAGGAVYEATVRHVLARVREGVLTPYGSHVLCREVYPPDVEEVEVLGRKLRLRVSGSGSGLTMGTEDVPPLPWTGEVLHVGLPLRGQPQRVRVGDRAIFYSRVCSPHTKLPLLVRIEGQEFLCIRQDYIVAVAD